MVEFGNTPIGKITTAKFKDRIIQHKLYQHGLVQLDEESGAIKFKLPSMGGRIVSSWEEAQDLLRDAGTTSLQTFTPSEILLGGNPLPGGTTSGRMHTPFVEQLTLRMSEHHNKMRSGQISSTGKRSFIGRRSRQISTARDQKMAAALDQVSIELRRYGFPDTGIMGKNILNEFSREGKLIGMPFISGNGIVGMFPKINGEFMSTKDILGFLKEEYNFRMTGGDKAFKRTRSLVAQRDLADIEQGKLFRVELFDTNRYGDFAEKLRLAGYSEGQIRDSMKAITDGSMIINTHTQQIAISNLRDRAATLRAQGRSYEADKMLHKAQQYQRALGRNVSNTRISGMYTRVDGRDVGIFGMAKGDAINLNLGPDGPDLIVAGESITTQFGVGINPEDPYDLSRKARFLSMDFHEASAFVRTDIESLTSNTSLFDLDHIQRINEREIDYIAAELRRGNIPQQIKDYATNVLEGNIEPPDDPVQYAKYLKDRRYAEMINTYTREGGPLGVSQNPYLMRQIMDSYTASISDIGKYDDELIPRLRVPAAMRAQVQSAEIIRRQMGDAYEEVAQGQLKFNYQNQTWYMAKETFERAREALGGPDFDDTIYTAGGVYRDTSITDPRQLGAFKLTAQRIPNTKNELISNMTLDINDAAMENILERESFLFGQADRLKIERVIKRRRSNRDTLIGLQNVGGDRAATQRAAILAELAGDSEYIKYVEELSTDQIGAMRRINVPATSFPGSFGMTRDGSFISPTDMRQPVAGIPDAYTLTGGDYGDVQAFKVSADVASDGGPTKKPIREAFDPIPDFKDMAPDDLYDSVRKSSNANMALGKYQNALMAYNQWIEFNHTSAREIMASTDSRIKQVLPRILLIQRQEEVIDQLIQAGNVDKDAVRLIDNMTREIHHTLGALAGITVAVRKDVSGKIDPYLLRSKLGGGAGIQAALAEVNESFGLTGDDALRLENMALESTDPKAFAARAQAMNAQNVSRAQRAKRKLLKEIQAPDYIRGMQFSGVEQAAARDFAEQYRSIGSQYGSMNLSDIDDAHPLSRLRASWGEEGIDALKRDAVNNDMLRYVAKEHMGKGSRVPIERLVGALFQMNQINNGSMTDVLQFLLREKPFGDIAGMTDHTISMKEVTDSSLEALQRGGALRTGDVNSMRSRILRAAPGQHPLGAMRQSMMNDAANAAQTVSEGVPTTKYKRITDSMKDGDFRKILESSNIRMAAAGVGLFALGGLLYGATKERTQEDMAGPPLLPGGSAYEDYSSIPSNMTSAYPSVSQGGFSPGVLYQVRAQGNFDPYMLQGQMQAITGSMAAGMIYSAGPTALNKRDELRSR